MWYSTDSLGWCDEDEEKAAPGCTWRVGQVVKVVNKTCSNNKVFTAVETAEAGAPCFATCHSLFRPPPL